jgi:large subunit ribosomal protein L6
MAKKIRKDLIEEIEIPEDIEAKIENNMIIMRKDSKELKRKIDLEIKAVKQDNKIILSVKKAKKNDKKKFGTAKSHLKNMVIGLTKGWEYELEICNVHFPMNVSFDKDKNEIIIKNLLGEKAPRIIKVSDQAEIEIKAPKITVKSYDKEIAGQTATNLEKVSRVRNRDRNKFQDGIFITKKPGREFI